MSEDWGNAWELPDYPKLPKLFTNAKTAKKRRHKELMVTDELLDCPVKLSKLTGDWCQGNGAVHRLRQLLLDNYKL